MGEYSWLNIRLYQKGKLSANELEIRENFDKIIERKDRNETEVIIEFADDDAVFEAIGLSEDDAWFIKSVNSPYYDYDVQDYSTTEDDFLNGYNVYYDFNEENEQLMRKIAQYLTPGEPYEETQDYLSKLSNILMELYNRDTRNIIDEYNSEFNDSSLTGIKKIIDEDLESAFTENGLFIERKFDKIGTTIGDLVKNYIKTGRFHIPAKELILGVLNNMKMSSYGGGYSEVAYEYGSRNFDSESFNRRISGYLENILENLEEEANPEFIKNISEIFEKYNIGVWYKVPKNERYLFMITGVNRENQTIEVKVNDTKSKGRNISISTFSYTIDSFYKFLHQPTLFGDL